MDADRLSIDDFLMDYSREVVFMHSARAGDPASGLRVGLELASSGPAFKHYRITKPTYNENFPDPVVEVD